MSFHLRSLESYASQDAATGTRVESRDPSQEQNRFGAAKLRRRLLTHASLARCPFTQFISFDLYVHILIVTSAVVCRDPL